MATRAPFFSHYRALRRARFESVVLTVAVFLFFHGAIGQEAGNPKLDAAASYDVVSVKPDPAGDPTKPIVFRETPESLVTKNVTLRLLIREAYQVWDYQILGAPKWVNSAEYEIDATIDDSLADKLKMLSPKEEETERRLMLQALLAARFQLRLHHETRQGAVYALVVAKNGPKFHEMQNVPTDQTKTLKIGGGEFVSDGQPMSTLAALLSQMLGRPVVDETGLSGKYQFMLKWTPAEFDLPISEDSDGASIFTVLQDQLGLRLESKKGPVDVLVIDHVEEPAPN